VYKAIVAIITSAVKESIVAHFVKNADRKDIPRLGGVVDMMQERQNEMRSSDIRKMFAESVPIYRKFTGLANEPVDVIETLLEFLVRIGFFLETPTATSDMGRQRKMYCFSHNAFMAFAVEETLRGMLDSEGTDDPAMGEALRQASAGAMRENIVMAHLLKSAAKGEKVFKYRDKEQREIDAVAVDRDRKTLRLIEVKAKKKIDTRRVFSKDAEVLYSDAVLGHIGVDGTFRISRTIVYGGDSMTIEGEKGDLQLTNIEEFLLGADAGGEDSGGLGLAEF
jgi:predicted AAA+ superfamily ATPase